MKKKVLHIINSLTIGGAETLLANSLSPGGLQEHTENYLAYLNKASYLLHIIDKEVKLICLDYKGGLDILRVLKELRRIIKENNIDVVHSHLTPSGLYTSWICPAEVPQVHTIHSTYSMETETRPILRFLDRYFFFNRQNCNIICLSDYTKDDFLNAINFKGQAFVLNNFVADRYFNLPPKTHAVAPQKLHLVAAGTLKELKNFEYLLEVFERLCDQEIYLDIYGEGDKEKYEKVIHNKRLKINMMGRVDDMATVLPRYDGLIMPSKFEGFPLAVFEAMAAGLPLLLSDIAPLRSIVKEHAIYFPLDDAALTAGMIRKVFTGHTDVNTMAVKARSFAEHTAKRELYINRLLDIYSQVVKLPDKA